MDMEPAVKIVTVQIFLSESRLHVSIDNVVLRPISIELPRLQDSCGQRAVPETLPDAAMSILGLTSRLVQNLGQSTQLDTYSPMRQ